MRAIAIISALLTLALAPSMAQEVFELTPIRTSPAGEDYAPVPMDSGFVMCSVRETQNAIAYRDGRTAKPLSDLYWVPYRDGRAGTPVLFSQTLTTAVNEGPSSFANEGRTICYTRNIAIPKRASSKLSNTQLGLYFSTLVQATWTEPVAFEYNSDRYSIMHPSLSADGDSLYFASDMPGGMGGTDLYLSVRKGPTWSTPKSLGSDINSAYHEAYPKKNGNTLQFASDRPGGVGKLDLYSTERIDGEWLAPLALPAPINSTGNDLGYHPITGTRTALMSSDRDGVDRIYVVERTVPKFRDCIPQEKNNYCYAFKTRRHAATSILPLDHVWDLGDGTVVTGLVAEHCYSEPGTYAVRSLLVDRRTRSLFQVIRSHDVVVEDKVQAYIASPDTIRTGRAMILDPRLSVLKGMSASGYHWDLGDGTQSEGPKVKHVYQSAGIYTVQLDIISSTDLGEPIRNRCNTKLIHVVDKYREHEDESIVAVYQDALGKTHSYEYQELPFDAFNLDGTELDDVKFSVELFASKERVSLHDPRFMELSKLYRIREEFDPKRNGYVYSIGETSDLEELYRMFQKVKELEFMDAEVFAMHEEQLIDLSSLAGKRSDELNGSRIRLNNILFAYKSSAIEPGSEETLARITSLLLQHQDLDLVIEAHTDDIGGGAYNLELSQARANSVLSYLVQQGIAAERFVAIGYGLNTPIASNKTPSGRSLNRRVEFRVAHREREDQALQPRQ